MLDTNHDPDNKKLTESLLASFGGLSALKGTDDLKVGKEGARQIATTGQPTNAASIAQALDMPEEKVQKTLQAFAETGLVYFEEDGQVAAMWAINSYAVPGVPHRMQLDMPNAPTVYPWCALDNMYFAHMFNQAVHVQSACSQTGRDVIFTAYPDGTVKNLTPASAMISVMVPDGPVTQDIRGSFCHFINFFADEAAGKAWAEKQSATIKLLPVAEAAKWTKDYTIQLFD